MSVKNPHDGGGLESRSCAAAASAAACGPRLHGGVWCCHASHSFDVGCAIADAANVAIPADGGKKVKEDAGETDDEKTDDIETKRSTGQLGKKKKRKSFQYDYREVFVKSTVPQLIATLSGRIVVCK